MPRLLLSAPAGPDTPSQRVAVAAANWQASPAHLLRAPLSGSAGRATATSTDPVAILGQSWAPEGETRTTRASRKRWRGGARVGGSVQGTGRTPPFCHRSPFPSLIPNLWKGSHSRHSETVEPVHQGRSLGQPGQERSALFLSVAYKDPLPPPRSYFV